MGDFKNSDSPLKLQLDFEMLQGMPRPPTSEGKISKIALGILLKTHAPPLFNTGNTSAPLPPLGKIKIYMFFVDFLKFGFPVEITTGFRDAPRGDRWSPQKNIFFLYRYFSRGPNLLTPPPLMLGALSRGNNENAQMIFAPTQTKLARESCCVSFGPLWRYN